MKEMHGSISCHMRVGSGIAWRVLSERGNGYYFGIFAVEDVIMQNWSGCKEGPLAGLLIPGIPVGGILLKWELRQ